MDLHVGPVASIAREEGSGIGTAHGKRSGPGDGVAQRVARQAPRPPEIVVDGDGPGDLGDDPNPEVILKIPAHVRRFHGDRDTEPGQVRSGADPGEHQQLGGVDRTGGEDDAAAGPHEHRCAEPVEAHPDRPMAGCQGHAVHRRCRGQLQVVTPKRGLEVGAGRAHAQPTPDGREVGTDADVVRDAQVAALGEACVDAGLDERAHERMIVARPGQRHLPVPPQSRVGVGGRRLARPEQCLGLGPGPGRVTDRRGPAVVVVRRAPDPDHAVDRARILPRPCRAATAPFGPRDRPGTRSHSTSRGRRRRAGG